MSNPGARMTTLTLLLAGIRALLASHERAGGGAVTCHCTTCAVLVPLMAAHDRESLLGGDSALRSGATVLAIRHDDPDNRCICGHSRALHNLRGERLVCGWCDVGRCTCRDFALVARRVHIRPAVPFLPAAVCPHDAGVGVCTQAVPCAKSRTS